MDNESTKVKTATFNGRNYTSWKFSVSIALKGHSLISIVDGTRLRPTEVT